MSFITSASTFTLILSFAPLSIAAAPTEDSFQVSISTPLQIPEAVLQPGKYKFDLEDHLRDRAIVRVTEPSGTQHYLLTVPTSTLPRTQGLIYFPSASAAKALYAWECPKCAKPLQFVYPKDEAVKLTAETGKPILAFDPSYDKLPDNLSPEDRKVVTLWLLSPKVVTPEGRGEGLTAAKYSQPANSLDAPPRRMPKTASNVYLKLLAGLLLLAGACLLTSARKLRNIWLLAFLGLTLGMVAGFALPLATQRQPNRFSISQSIVVVDPTVSLMEVGQSEHQKDDELARLKVRNRRLEVLLAALRQRNQ